MTSEIYIPGFTVTCLLITSIICIVAVLVAWYTVRSRVKFSQIILGAFSYVLVMLLENVLHLTAPAVSASGFVFAIYITLSMVVARETIRFLAMMFGVKANFSNTDASVGFALGFAGMYLLICGAYYFNCYTTATEYVKTGMDAFVANTGSDAEEALTLLGSIAAQSGWQFVCTGVNRVMFLVREIALCVLIWYTLTQEQKQYYLLVPLMSLAAFLPDGLYQAEVLTSSYAKDLITVAVSAGIAFLAARQYNAREDQVAHFQIERLRARKRR